MPAHSIMTLGIMLLAYGRPVQAIVAAFDWDERTVQRVQAAAGEHCQEVMVKSAWPCILMT